MDEYAERWRGREKHRDGRERVEGKCDNLDNGERE